jgi:N6-L-threonylcarbamoyladenine synthase
MVILGIETSCDETAAAVVRDGHAVLSNIVHTQIALHRPYGGVVPEIASRQHVEHLPAIIEEAMRVAGIAWGDIDAVAVTQGPGLATSLLVGLAAAKGLAIRLDKPLIGVNHLEAHLYSVFLGAERIDPAGWCPFVALIVSGGHTCFLRVDGIGRYQLLGRTVDDAAGEAFDKGANLLKLGYPGGPAIDKAAQGADPTQVRFPRGCIHRPSTRFGTLNFRICVSYSGLKTSLLYHLRDHPLTGADDPRIPGLAASYQEAVVDTLINRATHAMTDAPLLAVVGGVSLNRRLREKLAVLAKRRHFRLALAQPSYCTDNAAMVAGLAAHKLATALPLDQSLLIDANPNLGIGEP